MFIRTSTFGATRLTMSCMNFKIIYVELMTCSWFIHLKILIVRLQLQTCSIIMIFTPHFNFRYILGYHRNVYTHYPGKCRELSGIGNSPSLFSLSKNTFLIFDFFHIFFIIFSPKPVYFFSIFFKNIKKIQVFFIYFYIF